LAILYLVTDVGIILGLIAWTCAQQAWVGTWRTAGFVLAVVGVEVMRSSGALPGLVLYPLGALLVVVGVNVLAPRAWRAGQLPVWLPGLLLISAITGPMGYPVPALGAFSVLSGLTFGAGFAGVGVLVWRSWRRMSAGGELRSQVADWPGGA
jgi:hypothetical protein